MEIKPKMFIASSAEAEKFANAIHRDLMTVAECTVWVDAFRLSENTRDALIRNLHSSDFGAFVLSPDDIAIMRGQQHSVVRDNVIFELGLFTGYLGSDRCFFAAPKDAQILHLPSDFLGVTRGHYEATRSDDNWLAAVRPFCTEIEPAIKRLVFFTSSIPETLRVLAVKYDCANWISAEDERVKRKRSLFEKCKDSSGSGPLSGRTSLQTNEPKDFT